MPRCQKTKPVADLLSPLHWKSFLSSHYEKHPLYLPPSAARLRFFERSEWNEVSIYQGKSLPANALEFFTAQNQHAPKQKRARLLKSKHYRSFIEKENGSILLHGVQSFSKNWSKTARAFSTSFGSPANVNGYLTPAGEQTFARHWDDHDVFVFQISGRKKWEVFAPMISQPLNAVTHCPRSKKLFSVTLEPGALLYIPKGFPHCARALDSTSFHLSLGLSVLRNYDVLYTAFQQILLKATQDPFFRASCNSLDRNHPATLKKLFPSFLERVEKYLSTEEIRKLAYDFDRRKETSPRSRK